MHSSTFIGGTIGIHPDFGSGQYNGGSIGIPYAVVGSQQAPLTLRSTRTEQKVTLARCLFQQMRTLRGSQIQAINMCWY
jgi:hypothetical protein